MNTATHNIIGDIHGREVWKQLVDDNLVNIFVGDFFDPYSFDITYDDCKRNFLEIVNYKRHHPSNTVLLWGNHELHYLLQWEMPDERYTRFDYMHADIILKLLEQNRGYFSGIAYAIGDEYLVTHAGVSRYWYMRWIERYGGQPPAYVAEQINQLWNVNPKAFTVLGNQSYPYDDEGTTQSPLWIRPDKLRDCNLFEDTPYRQIFGHTQCNGIREHKGLICVDCLQRTGRQEQTEPLSLRISASDAAH